MRFAVILIALVLLPVMVAVHAWDYSEHQEPRLTARALGILQREGIRGATVDLRYLDLGVTGDAPDVASVERATVALKGLAPTRLVKNGLSILAHLGARLQDQTLVLEGWLPADCSAADVSHLLATLRPDLQIDAARLQVSSHVRWPEGEKGPLSTDSVLVKGVLPSLRVLPSLEMVPHGEMLMISGVLPEQALKEAIMKACDEAAPALKSDASMLRVTPQSEVAAFAKMETLIPFIRSFYGTPVPGSFSITAKAGPRIKALATPTLESEWLGLLRPLSGGKQVDMELSLYPSVYHFPGYRPTTPLPAEQLESLRQSLSDFYVVFDGGSATISAGARARLAGLLPTLLAAGPSLRLIVGGHPDIGGQAAAQHKLALARAEQVVSYLIEQGAPATDMQAVAFDVVPPGSPGTPLQSRSVEILIK